MAEPAGPPIPVLQLCEPTHAGAARVTINLADGLRRHGEAVLGRLLDMAGVYSAGFNARAVCLPRTGRTAARRAG